jgi:hypothetical protein
MATVGVAELALGAAVEIECIATQGDNSVQTAAEPLFQQTGFVESEGESIYYEVTGKGPRLVLADTIGGLYTPEVRAAFRAYVSKPRLPLGQIRSAAIRHWAADSVSAIWRAPSSIGSSAVSPSPSRPAPPSPCARRPLHCVGASPND